MNMSDGLKKFAEALREDEQLQDVVAGCETAEESAKAAQDHGYEVSKEEVGKAVEA